MSRSFSGLASSQLRAELPAPGSRPTSAAMHKHLDLGTRDFGIGKRLNCDNWNALRSAGEHASQRRGRRHHFAASQAIPPLPHRRRTSPSQGRSVPPPQQSVNCKQAQKPPQMPQTLMAGHPAKTRDAGQRPTPASGNKTCPRPDQQGTRPARRRRPRPATRAHAHGTLHHRRTGATTSSVPPAGNGSPAPAGRTTPRCTAHLTRASLTLDLRRNTDLHHCHKF